MQPLPFYFSRKQAAQAVYAAYLAAANATALGGSVVGSSLSDVKPKERRRMAAVEDMLSKGENPYSADVMKKEGKNLGGSLQRPKREKSNELDPATLARLEAKWAERPQGRLPMNITDDLIAELGLAPTEKFQTTGLVCSFCSDPVDFVRATYGTGPLTKAYKDEPILDADGKQIGTERKLTHYTPQLIACPKCCLFIKNIKFKD